MLVTNHEEKVSISLDNEVVKGNKSVKLLGIKIDNKIDFNEHISIICKKTSVKQHGLASVALLRKMKTTSSNESFYRCSIQLLSVNLDVSQQIIK